MILQNPKKSLNLKPHSMISNTKDVHTRGGCSRDFITLVLLPKKGVLNANHNHNYPLPPSTPLLCQVYQIRVTAHAHLASRIWHHAIILES